jgi:acyl carrier protein
METSAAQAPATEAMIDKLKQLVITVAKLKVTQDEISDNANLFDDCGIDSTSLIELVLSIEETCGVTMTEDELEMEVFQNLSRLAHFINSKIALQAGIHDAAK